MARWILTSAVSVLLASSAAESPGGTGGLAVRVGADPTPVAAMARGGMYVHVVDADPAKVHAARAELISRGLYGVRVAATVCDPGRLPYAENTVNALWAGDTDAVAALKLTREEILRVLAPGASATLGTETIRKPRPAGMGQWTHPRCGPDGNPVSEDLLVAPSQQLRWLAGPLWGHHRGPVGGVCAGGRLIYVLREQPLGTHVMPRYWLTARDAYNGMLLWRKPIRGRANGKWPHFTARYSPAVLVATDDRVFTVAEAGEPLTALDAATGKVVKTYADAPPPELVLFSDGVLILARRGDLYAVDAADGKLLWKQTGTLTRARRVWSSSVVLIAHGRVFFRRQRKKGGPVELLAVELRTGRQVWVADVSKLPPAGKGAYGMMLHYAKAILLRSEAATCAVSAEDGSMLWHRPGRVDSAFGMGGRLWLQGKISLKGAKYGWAAVDPATGRGDREIGVPQKLPEGIRGKRILDGQCNFQVATPNYIVTTTRMSLLDVRTGEFHNTMITRGPCKFLLAIPANGLLYTFPKDCVCYPCLRGTLAYAPAGPVATTAEPPRVKGPAFGLPVEANAGAQDWPTYRADPQRSASTATTVFGKIETLWSVQPGGRLTAPVASEGKVFVASTDRHLLHALDAATGATVWTFIAGGRIDSPPTITGGLCIFGSRDGWVYCLRADDGRLVWRLRAAPAELLIPAFEQVESAWPAFGSVLARDGAVFVSAGRHANAAGGISVYGLDAATGEVRWRNAPTYECVNNVLTSTPAGNVFLAYYKIAYDPATGRRVRDTATLVTSRDGFLNDETIRVVPVFDAGRIVNVYGGPFRRQRRQPNVPGKGYEVTLSTRPAKGKPEVVWTRSAVPVRINSVVLTKDVLFVAGGKDGIWDPDAENPWAVLDGQIGGLVLSLSAEDGKDLHKTPLEAPTVRDGLIAANGRLYAATKSGRLHCLGPKP